MMAMALTLIIAAAPRWQNSLASGHLAGGWQSGFDLYRRHGDGFSTFRPQLNIAGVIVNRVNSDSHYQLQNAIERYCGFRCSAMCLRPEWHCPSGIWGWSPPASLSLIPAVA
jgi:hypothetical protein